MTWDGVLHRFKNPTRCASSVQAPSVPADAGLQATQTPHVILETERSIVNLLFPYFQQAIGVF